MAKIDCQVDEIEMENDEGRTIAGVGVTCSECGHTTESFGTGSKSIARCLVMLREECPEMEENFYVVE